MSATGLFGHRDRLSSLGERRRLGQRCNAVITASTEHEEWTMMVGRGHRGRPGGGGRVGRGGRPAREMPPTDDLTAWLSGRLPDGWFTGAPEVTVDREEILVVGELPAPENAADADPAARAASAA